MMEYQDPDLKAVADKVEAGQRLDADDALRCMTTWDVPGLGRLADRVRQRRHGKQTYFVINRHINYTNICYQSCKFCAFGKKLKEDESYFLDLETIFQTADDFEERGVREVHIVGGLHPTQPFSYYVDIVQGLKERHPDLCVKAFTPVEINHFAKKDKSDWKTVLSTLHQAGLDSMPGGGAEIFDPVIREKICAVKLSADDWCQVHQIAHELGLRTNATMLYGHLEGPEHRRDHLLRLRQAQDDSGGFLAYIPLAFHPENTDLSHLPPSTGLENLRQVAAARLILDNFEHIKSYWIIVGHAIAQVAQHYGANDLDGTVVQERIYHMAGSQTPQETPQAELKRLITEAGFEAVERDALYQQVAAAV